VPLLAALVLSDVELEASPLALSPSEDADSVPATFVVAELSLLDADLLASSFVAVFALASASLELSRSLVVLPASELVLLAGTEATSATLLAPAVLVEPNDPASRITPKQARNSAIVAAPTRRRMIFTRRARARSRRRSSGDWLGPSPGVECMR
jgi:hypothetical protein